MQAAAHAPEGISAYLLARLSGAAPGTLRRWAELGILRPPTFLRPGAGPETLAFATRYRPIDVAAALLALALRRAGADQDTLARATGWLYAAQAAGARWERAWVIQNADGSFRLAELAAADAHSVYLPHPDELPLLMRFSQDERRGLSVQLCNTPPSIRAPRGDR